ncbi:Eukaryotic translation initiation factor 2C [Rhizophlyctis rosea]|uniref:Eukaryotic translation initiation factor 2C n=1 Tax=Rhizophlyctis rosea TaxID=64517 RepID=A0AAD5S5S1_9FUNG|nr:Eukaryotic translation initiation factor 2C [Rhizophlyctis rosea]
MSSSHNQQVATLPRRPGVGSSGNRARIRSNFFPITGFPNQVYQYDVEITPTAPRRINQQIFQLAKDISSQFFSKSGRTYYTAYDGSKIAYSPEPLPLREGQVGEVIVELPKEEGRGSDSPRSTRTRQQQQSMEIKDIKEELPKPKEEDEKKDIKRITLGSSRPGRDDLPPSSSGSSRDRRFILRMKFAANVDLRRVGKLVDGQLPPNAPIPHDGLNALNVIVRHYPSIKENTIPVGAGFYMRDLFIRSQNELHIGGGAEAWNGLKVSARPGVDGMYLLADVGTTAFRKSGPLLEVIADILNKRDSRELRLKLTDHEIRKIEKELKNFRVLTTHTRDFKRKYRISGITSKPADRIEFEWEHEGRRKVVSVAEYFERCYSVRLQYPHLPCVQANSKSMFIPFECLAMAPNQRIVRKLNEQQTGMMIRVAQKKPQERLNRTVNGVTEMVGQAQSGRRTNEYLTAFGVQVADKPTDINTRILAPPTIFYHESSRENQLRPRDGTWNLRDKKVAASSEHITHQPLRFWSVLVLNIKLEMIKRIVENFVVELVRTCRNTGMEIANSYPVVRDNNGGSVEEAMRRAYEEAKRDRGTPQMILVVLPDTGQTLYAEVKRISDTVLGIPTQCVQRAKIMKPNVQYCANVCLKMNAKLGGYNSFLGSIRGAPQLPFLTEKPTIVIGIDVTHPAAFDTSRPTIAAMVGSLDHFCANFASVTRIQRAPPGLQRQDHIKEIVSMTKELLKKPERVLVYRDGVSDGQFETVLHHEVAGMREACNQMEAGYRPTITYVVVQKRHHARFYPTSQAEGDKSGNVRPGTVVDTSVVHPVYFDFYLNSHAGLQGTSRPAHYWVLHDENHFTADSLQELTYRLCYLYARCTRSVSICPPVYYADLVCSRARFHFKDLDWSETESRHSDHSAEQIAKMIDAQFMR